MSSDLAFKWEVKEDKLMINTMVDNMLYQAEWTIDPQIEIEDITSALDDKQFKIVTKAADLIKIKVGFLNLEFKNLEKLNIDEMKSTIQKLTNKVAAAQKSIQALKKQLTESKTDITNLQTAKKDLEQKNTNLQNLINGQNTKIQNLQQILISKCPLYFAPQIVFDDKFHESSKIVKPNQEKFIKDFLDPKKINFMKMLYRASENDFSVKKFHLKCDGVPNTLVLVETEFGKKIGGFNPFCWESCRKPDFGSYLEKEAFIFSLTHNEKFSFKDNKRDNMVINEMELGPIFGNGRDLIIADKANIYDKSYTHINSGSSSYEHPNYKQGTKQSWERFCGNKQNQSIFKIKEWEVWYVEFL